VITALRPWFALVRFEHSLFALPFALVSAWLAARGLPQPRVLLLVCLCAIAARTAAMAFNRYLDRELDAANPRTSRRELPRGVLSARAALALALGAALVFMVGAWALNPLCGWLALPVLAVLFGYSATKRFTACAHLVLGLALALAPLGAWVAVRGNLAGDLGPPLYLALAVLTWVAGFDLIYACQDEAFDRARGLFSIPARFGTAWALRLSGALHIGTLVALVLFARRAGLGWVFGLALAVVAVLLLWQHTLVSPRDLSRVDMAFFTLNGWVSVGVFVGVVLELARQEAL
jgi:4-hydroxybenzoate polyprenyltransferase